MIVKDQKSLPILKHLKVEVKAATDMKPSCLKNLVALLIFPEGRYRCILNNDMELSKMNL
jgi:hypothetical protein